MYNACIIDLLSSDIALCFALALSSLYLYGLICAYTVERFADPHMSITHSLSNTVKAADEVRSFVA